MAEERKVTCPLCGAGMEQKLQNFSIGADGGGGLITLLADTYEVDLYACPRCGKVELFTAGFQPEQQSQAEAPREQPEPKSGGLFGFGRKKQEERPPWEN